MASYSTTPLKVGKGRSKSWLATCTDPVLGLLDLSANGRSLRFRARYNETDPDPPVLLKATGSGIVHDPDQVAHKGQATVTFVPADTSGVTATRLWYELDMLEGGDVYELAKGTLWVEGTL